MNYLRRMPDKPATHRIRFILKFAYGTGLRRAELAATRTTHVVREFAGPELGMITVLKVIGKRDTERRIPLSPMILEAIGDYLEHRGLPRDPLLCAKGTPIIAALPDNRDIQRAKAEGTIDALEVVVGSTPRKEKPITPAKLYNAIKRFFENVASAAAFEQPELGASWGNRSNRAKSGGDRLKNRL